MPLHVHAAAAESDPFGFQSKALLDGGIAAQFDLASCAEHPMPRKPKRTAQHPDHLPGSSGIPCTTRHAAICRNFAARNLADCRDDANLQVHSAIHPTRISHKDVTETSSHKTTPCSSGRCPTSLSVATEIPVPIKYNVAVSPIFAALLASA